MNSGPIESRDTLFYNGECSLCLKEMQKLKSQANDTLLLVDINKHDDLPFARTELRERLHIKLASGIWLKGVDANIRAWEHTPKRQLVSRLRWPILHQLTKIAYEVWLLWYKYQSRRRVCSIKPPLP